MIGYRDMTFCPFYEDCADSSTCPRPLTPEVKDQATKWWGQKDQEAPIVQFAEKPDCHRLDCLHHYQPIKDIPAHLSGGPTECCRKCGGLRP